MVGQIKCVVCLFLSSLFSNVLFCYGTGLAIAQLLIDTMTNLHKDVEQCLAGGVIVADPEPLTELPQVDPTLPLSGGTCPAPPFVQQGALLANGIQAAMRHIQIYLITIHKCTNFFKEQTTTQIGSLV